MGNAKGQYPRSYDDCQTIANGKHSPTIANNTRLIWDRFTGQCAVTLHKTAVVTFCYSGCVVLDSGGWRTTTTKNRINACLPSGFSLCQIDFEWWISASDGMHKFYDGMHLWPTSEGCKIT